MSPEQYCRQKVAAYGSDLHYSLLCLGPEQQRAVTALHALHAGLEDTVGEARDPGIARTRLAWWRDELTAALNGQPHHPVSQALAPGLRRWQLPRDQLIGLIDGAQLDLDYNRYPDFATLEVYCQRNLGALCKLSSVVLEDLHPGAGAFSQTLGTALQLARVIRNAGVDARRNRIYFPLDELQRFRLDAEDIVALRQDERFEQLMVYQIQRARSFLLRADGMLDRDERKAQRAHLVMAALQRTLLDEIERLRGHTLTQRVALTPVRKLWIAWKTR
jgi:phytoene synthase